MVSARLTQDNNWIICEFDNIAEKRQLQLAFTVHIPNWWIIKKKAPYANIDETFMNSYGMIPVGLWLQLVNVCKKYNIPLSFSDDFNCRIKDCTLVKDTFDNFFKNLFTNEKLVPKQYQLDAVYNALLYKNCCLEVSTSGGKTLISYMLFKYMIDILDVKHILYITPKTVLTTQSSDKFMEYDTTNGVSSDWTYGEIHATAKKKEEYNETIVFGNYQSLCKKKAEFFKKYDVVVIDECHHSATKSLKNILKKCVNAKYKIGMTGTFPKQDTYENYSIQSFIGPVVYRLTSFDLINKENFATPVVVSCIEMKYLDKERLEALYNLRITKDRNDPTAGGNLYKAERNIARESNVRFKYICNLISKTTKNTLVIFSDIQNEYGNKVYTYVKDNTDKNVYYIDGSTPTNTRDSIKQAMEDDTEGNTIIVASMGCFTEGIDIANMWNIFLIESTKSDNTLAQLLGRGMRKYPGKEKTIMIDFIDDFRYGQGYYSDNYLYRHGKERQSIYKNRGFSYSTISVDLTVPSAVSLIK